MKEKFLSVKQMIAERLNSTAQSCINNIPQISDLHPAAQSILKKIPGWKWNPKMGFHAGIESRINSVLTKIGWAEMKYLTIFAKKVAEKDLDMIAPQKMILAQRMFKK